MLGKLWYEDIIVEKKVMVVIVKIFSCVHQELGY